MPQPLKDVEGLEKTLQTLKEVHTVVYEQMNLEIKDALSIIQKDAQKLIPNDPPKGLSNWDNQARNTLWFRLRFNPVTMKNGIKISLGKSRNRSTGFTGLYQVLNTNPAAMVYELAGTRNPNGRPAWKKSGKKGQPTKSFSVSDNPDAGKHFIDSIVKESGITVRGKTGGRVVRTAGMRDDAKVREKIYQALEKASKITYTRLPDLRA